MGSSLRSVLLKVTSILAAILLGGDIQAGAISEDPAGKVVITGGPANTPAIANGRIYVTGGGELICLAEVSLEILWRGSVGVVPAPGPGQKTAWRVTPPAIGRSGTIYVGNDLGEVYAFDSAGKNLWSTAGEMYSEYWPDAGSDPWHRLPVTADETVYCKAAVSSSGGARVYVVRNGAVLRKTDRVPVIGPEGNLYFSLYPTNGMRAESAGGEHLWDSPYPTPSTFDALGNLYTQGGGLVLSLTKTAHLRWETPFPTSTILGLAVGNRLVFATTSEGVVALDRTDGAIRWTNSLAGWVAPTSDGGAHILHISQAGWNEPQTRTLLTVGWDGSVRSVATNTWLSLAQAYVQYSPPVIGAGGWTYFHYGKRVGGVLESAYTGTAPPVEIGLFMQRLVSGELELRSSDVSAAGVRLESSPNLKDWADAFEMQMTNGATIQTTNSRNFYRAVKP